MLNIDYIRSSGKKITLINTQRGYYMSQKHFAENLCGGKFHNQLRDVFAPQVVRYVDLMESSIAQSIHKGFEKEMWKPQGYDTQEAACVQLQSLSFDSQVMTGMQRDFVRKI